MRRLRFTGHHDGDTHLSQWGDADYASLLLIGRKQSVEERGQSSWVLGV